MHQHIKFFFIIFFLTHNLFGRVLPSDIIWNENETGYYSIKDNNIILVSTKGKADKTILPSSKINNINIESFTFSKSKNKILLFTKSVKCGGTILGATTGSTTSRKTRSKIR